ncbi:MAG: hypothetical protein N2Z22_09630 [Turneriella sp.]|nr:hypothetical protein [Turneriella sp.]
MPKAFIALFAIFPLVAITVEGRLPGEFFDEDNPPRFGSIMSFSSRSGSTLLLYTRKVQPEYTIAAELQRLRKSMKFKTFSKDGILEGEIRWLRYAYLKEEGAGWIFITRRDNWLVYLIVFNPHREFLAAELPWIERYLRQLKIQQ